MASGRSVELAKIRRRPVMLTPVARGAFALPFAGTATVEDLDRARAAVRRADARHLAAARKRWFTG